MKKFHEVGEGTATKHVCFFKQQLFLTVALDLQEPYGSKLFVASERMGVLVFFQGVSSQVPKSVPFLAVQPLNHD